ncbi:MAG: hypothetical protein JWQ11_3001, partial [Rhizobacter sp.]|nr:hypothetical protein [Rhizobacter sp.]
GATGAGGPASGASIGASGASGTGGRNDAEADKDASTEGLRTSAADTDHEVAKT